MRRRRYRPWTTVAIVVASVALCLAYAFVPVPRSHGLDGSSIATIIVATVLVLVLAAFAAIGVFTTRWPLWSRAVELLALFVVVIVGYATTYYVVSRGGHHAFTQPLSKIDALYFSITVITTTGFGDISARSEFARLTVSSELLAGVLLLTISVAGIVSFVVSRVMTPPSTP